MINQKQINHIIVNELKKVCGCEVIKANQSHELPPYPFLSFQIITPIHKKGGTYSKYETYKEKELTQTWSIMVQSENDSEALEIAMKAHDFLEEESYLSLQEQEITVRKVSDISSRDNLISIEYEYRKGFDVTFAFMNRIDEKQEQEENVIETTKFNKEESN